MRRPTRFGLAVAVLLLVAAGGYTAYWFISADRLADGIGQWAQSLRAQHVDLTWRAIHVGGFPFALDVELSDARLRDDAQLAEIQVPQLLGRARPWNFRVWRLAAPGGLSAAAGPAGIAVASLSARAAIGDLTVDATRGTTLRLALEEPSARSGVTLSAQAAELRLTVPPHAPQGHDDPALALGLTVRRLSLPTAPDPAFRRVDEVGFDAAVMGEVPAAPPRQAAAAWRDAGGTVELEHFALRWGSVAVSANGTLALDSDLQPMAALSGSVEGYQELMAALVAGGRLRGNDAKLAGLALALLAKTGPDGRPEIATSFTIQNGEMYLGPVKLGAAPRIAW